MLAGFMQRFSAGGAVTGAAAAGAASWPVEAQCKGDSNAADAKMTPSFDPEALERGAKALREINASPYAKKVRRCRNSLGPCAPRPRSHPSSLTLIRRMDFSFLFPCR